jgi:hypothetical protein
MITYLEIFLGESTKAWWEQWVESNPGLYEEIKRVGSNTNNFANIISNIVIEEDQELEYTSLQNERLREIEKLTLTNWKESKSFSNIIHIMHKDITKV